MPGALLELTYADYGAAAVLERRGSFLHYWLRNGQAKEAPLVMFLHGAGVDHRMWASQMDAFAAHYRVLTLDLRGHGQSRPFGNYDFTTIVDDCIAVLDAAGADKAVPIGLSMGGNVAQEMAFRSPRRVSALVCADCTCNTLVPWLDRSTVPFYAALFGPMLAPYPVKPLLERIAKSGSITPHGRRYLTEASSQHSKAQFATIMTTLLRALHHERGYTMPVPELLLQGADDGLGNIRKIMPKWHKRDKGSRFAIVPHAGHVANIDNPAFFNYTVLEWLRQTISASDTPKAA